MIANSEDLEESCQIMICGAVACPAIAKFASYSTAVQSTNWN